MEKAYEIYGCIEIPQKIFMAEEKGLLTDILNYRPMIQARGVDVFVYFENVSDEDLHDRGAGYIGLGDILEEKLRTLYTTYSGKIRGEVFIVKNVQPQELKMIKINAQFETEAY